MLVSSGLEVCVYPFTHGIVYMPVHACLYVCIVCVYVCMHMYVSIHNFMSECERCMWNNGCIETLHIWHICIPKNMCVLKFIFYTTISLI